MIEIDVALRLGAFALEARIAARGRTLAICGASGAGKTTLLNVIAGLLRPSAGRVAVDGTTFLDTAEGVDLAPRHRRIGYVFQEPRLFPHLSVAQNLRYGQRYAPSARRLVDFDAVTSLLGLDALLTRRPAGLSGGEKQRVAIGRALLVSPRLLLMDEPLSSLDDARRLDILGYIEKMRDAFSIPIVFVSHRVSEVERLASDIAVLDQGRLVEMRAGGAALPSSS
ncbi:molybdenum ABC transporter ATP-binding protein [Methylocapsa sp. S129]|uniref:molybdenum ABC transporter ATP-binding protein n=1 Tax=Methylocapsa sp. S129 TaxID=1641869 RepID=UPI00131AB4C1|nr:molybdenum ABC transporter ATP-binding protein [Methylocapsa sp. S129]